jgi:hypothetical protein
MIRDRHPFAALVPFWQRLREGRRARTAPPFQPTRDDLVASSEHLLYEIEMLCQLANYIKYRRVDSVTTAFPDGGGTARNAIIEAFAVHSRVLHDFFFYRRSTVDKPDVLARQYVKDWKEKPPPILKPLIRRVGQEIVHLSHGRASLVEEAKSWRHEEMRDAFADLVRRFVQQVDDADVFDGF